MSSTSCDKNMKIFLHNKYKIDLNSYIHVIISESPHKIPKNCVGGRRK
jgi:hypothetical protein